MNNFNIPLPQFINDLNFSDKSAIQETLFVLFCYANNQADLAKNSQDFEAATKWKQLVHILDRACELLDEQEKDDACFLVY